MCNIRQIRKSIKSRANKNGIEFTLSSWQMRLLFDGADKCPICCCEFVDEENHQSARSLDRLDSSIGYVYENVNVTCRRCNSMKGLYDERGGAALLKCDPILGQLILEWIASMSRGVYAADDR